MEKSNQHPKTEGCLAEGEPTDLWVCRPERPSRSVPRERREPQAGVASCLSHSTSKEPMQAGTVSVSRYPILRRPSKVRASKACRGLRAWHMLKQTHGTEETRRVPAALTTRAKQEGWRNDKKCRLALQESDWPIVSRDTGEGANAWTKH